LKLYDLVESYQNIQNLIDAEDADNESLGMALSVIETEIEAKAQNVTVIIKGLEADAATIKAEEKRLADRRKALENKSAWLKGYLTDELSKAGLEKVKTHTFTIALQNNPPAVNITDEKAIPAKYLTIVPETYVIDKKAIADAIKRGEKVLGAELTVGKSLRIR
jgi:hypothetical protein